jgi:asparagine synthase (glutamine-hydrolysing)
MSGIVAIFNRDSAPADRELLVKMTGAMAFRGPDAQGIWTDGPIGFGHTLLRTTWESEREKQPCSLDGQVWITADVRLDGRDDLIHQLQSAGRHPSQDATDPELVLHAYDIWSERCPERLLGDFSFAIWDGRARRVFCARDHFGVKPFYYSQAGENFVCSNTLNCVRLSPAVSGKLNDAAIADFLLVGVNQNPATTTFSDIQRLPAGHCLVCSERQFRISRYWSLPVEDPILYKRADDYVEQFKDLLRSAVRDRLRTDRVGVFMSGGLDSPALAATAREILAARSSSYDLRAYTFVYDRLIWHDERHYAGLVADALGIPIHFLVADGYGLYERWEQPELHTPEPVHNPIGLALGFDQFAEVKSHCRVMLHGEDPDSAMYYEWQPYVLHLLKTFRWGRLLRDLWWHARFHREAPIWGGLRNRLRRARPDGRVAAQPNWIRPEILKLATSAAAGQGQPRAVHPFHPVAYNWLTEPSWDALFEGLDAAVTSFPVEVRHPYMDVRVVRYLLAIPRIPWCRSKYLIRRAFHGVLPDAVLRRPKTPLRSDPVLERAKATGLPEWVPQPALMRYVDPEIVRTVLQQDKPGLSDSLRVLSLNFFLASNA